MDLNIANIVNVYYSRTDHWHRDFFAPRNFDGIVFFTEGEIEYSFSDRKLTAQAGDLLFLPGNIPYSGKKKSECVAFFVIDFTCTTADEFAKAIGAKVVSAMNYHEKFSEIVDVWKKQRIDQILRIKSFLYALLCNGVSTGKSLTDDIIDYICDNIGSPSLSVKNLCERFYISESQLRRNILKQTGLKPNEYITQLRLNMAKNELSYTTDSIAQIAERCGFSSAYYFSNTFSRYNGMSPTQYRQSIII